MAIDKSGKFWTGAGASDIDEYLGALTASNAPATDRYVHAACVCGSAAFGLAVDNDEGCAQRTCTRCKTKHLICDSADSVADAELEPVTCPCGGKEFQICVGFAHRDDRSIKWVYIGHRCTRCGVLASSVDWKVDYAPAEHLYDHV
jgi:hypothetical protein